MPWQSPGFDHGADVTVLENPAADLPRFADDDIDHRAGQVVGSNHQIGEEQLKRRVDRPQQAVVEVRFLTRLHGVDIRGPKYVNTREPILQESFLRLALVAREGHAASLVGSAPFPLRKENAALGLLPWR